MDNFQLRIGSTTVETSANPDVAGEYPQPVFGPVYLTGAQAVTIRNNGAATAGSIYSATLDLVPVAGDQVSLYREISSGPAATAGNPENFLYTFSAAGQGSEPTWNPGGGLMLRSPDTLLLVGTNLAASSVTISLEGIQVEHRWLWKYLL